MNNELISLDLNNLNKHYNPNIVGIDNVDQENSSDDINNMLSINFDSSNGYLNKVYQHKTDAQLNENKVDVFDF